MRSVWLTLVAGTLLAMAVSPVWAHSLLLNASPAAGSTVAPPPRVSLTFNNRLEKRLSSLRLVDARGEAHVLTLLPDGSPERLDALLPPLAPGAYRLEWSVLSIDGHVVSGAVPFRVGP